MTTTAMTTKAGPGAKAAADAADPGGSGRRAAVRTVLATVERLMFRGDAMDVARANAWSAVQRDRERARERAEAWAALDGAEG